MITRLLCAFVALFLFAIGAHADGFLPSTKPLTRGTACGAPGVGLKTNATTGKLVAYEGQFADHVKHVGQRVGIDGKWAVCTMPPDCRSAVLATVRDTDGPKTIYNRRPSALPPGYVGDPQRSVIVIRGTNETEWRGHQVFKCDGKGDQARYGGWTLADNGVPWSPDALGAR